jgi:hydrogenase-4 membrane subunit HyfE
METANNRKKFIFYGIVFAIVAALDLVNFLFTGTVAVVNWKDPIHYGWVLAALGLFWLAIILRKKILFRALFYVYLITFVLAFLNQYMHFTPVLTSYCMLVNALLASAYLFAM